MCKIILRFLSILCLLYFVFLMIMLGPTVTFNYIWLFLALILLCLVIKYDKIIHFIKNTSKLLTYGVSLILILGGMIFIYTEGKIVKQSTTKPELEASYLIVLGAKVNGSTPSKILDYRIDRAAEYLLEHNETKVIVSGGKGSDESISEAEAMERGLISRGISKKRILQENQSTSTKENLDFSKFVIEENGGNIQQQDIIIVTTDFHVLRAIGIAKKCGFERIEGISSKSVWYLIPTNYFREFFAVLKDKLIGNL